MTITLATTVDRAALRQTSGAQALLQKLLELRADVEIDWSTRG